MSEGRGVKGSQISANLIEAVDTRKELATLAGVSHDTIAKVEAILETGTDALKTAIRSGDASIHAGAQV